MSSCTRTSLYRHTSRRNSRQAEVVLRPLCLISCPRKNVRCRMRYPSTSSPGSASTDRISPPNSGVTRSSASTTKTQGWVASPIAQFLNAEYPFHSCSMRRQSSMLATISKVPSVEPESATKISSAIGRTDSIQARMFIRSSLQGISTVRRWCIVVIVSAYQILRRCPCKHKIGEFPHDNASDVGDERLAEETCPIALLGSVAGC